MLHSLFKAQIAGSQLRLSRYLSIPPHLHPGNSLPLHTPAHLWTWVAFYLHTQLPSIFWSLPSAHSLCRDSLDPPLCCQTPSVFPPSTVTCLSQRSSALWAAWCRFTLEPFWSTHSPVRQHPTLFWSHEVDSALPMPENRWDKEPWFVPCALHQDSRGCSSSSGSEKAPCSLPHRSQACLTERWR